MIPKEGSLPGTKDALQLFYDSLSHAAAVINGVNTSGIIDATILNRPGIAILTEKYKATQEGTQHFRQLVHGGVLYAVNKFEEFPDIVDKITKDDPKKKERGEFILNYIRPRGLNKLAGEAAREEIDQLLTRNR